jgi:hypothetical protein
MKKLFQATLVALMLAPSVGAAQEVSCDLPKFDSKTDK